MDQTLPARVREGSCLAQRIRLRIDEQPPAGNATRTFLDNVWPPLRPEYDAMRKKVEDYLRVRLQQSGISCDIESRTKATDSVEKSIERRGKGKSLTVRDIFHEVHDLVGFRVVVDQLKDLEEARRFVEDTFQEMKKPAVISADRAVGSWNAWFGAYSSTHYRVGIKPGDDNGDDSGCASDYCGVMFEVQLTTIAESMYNRFAHDLLYKELEGRLPMQSQKILDLIHGQSRCYMICVDVLKGCVEAEREREGSEGGRQAASEAETVAEIVASGKRLYGDLTSTIGPDDFETLSIPDDLRSINDLDRWVAGEEDKAIEKLLAEQLKVQQEHCDATKEMLRLHQDASERMLSEQESRCLEVFRSVKGGTDYEWYKSLVEDHVDGTCQWLTGHEHFKRWLSQDSGQLLVTADPGCGKSVLSKYLIDSKLPDMDKDAVICYFFFKDHDQQTIQQALCAVLHQLLSKRRCLIKHAVAEYENNGQTLCEIKESLWKVLESAGKDVGAGPVIIVLDALDECEEADVQFLIRSLKKVRARDEPFGRVKFLLTSRPYENITNKFHGFSYIRILGEDESDAISREVDLVVEARVGQFAQQFNLQADLAAHLKSGLSSTEHRTYLWVYLAFDLLASMYFSKTRKGISSLLASVPKTLHEVYEKFLSQTHDREALRKLLCIMLAAFRPLTVTEMNIALALDSTTEDAADLDLEDPVNFQQTIRSLCGLLVSVHRGKIYFLHQTVREFLWYDAILASSQPATLKWHRSISMGDAHGLLGTLCAQCIEIRKRSGNGTEALEFYSYADEFLMFHGAIGALSSFFSM